VSGAPVDFVLDAMPMAAAHPPIARTVKTEDEVTERDRRAAAAVFCAQTVALDVAFVEFASAHRSDRTTEPTLLVCRDRRTGNDEKPAFIATTARTFERGKRS